MIKTDDAYKKALEQLESDKQNIKKQKKDFIDIGMNENQVFACKSYKLGDNTTVILGVKIA